MAELTDWTFEGSWPYEAQWFDSADGRVHYVDEGARDGRPVVLVHGNTTWAYLYRHFIPPLVEAGHRRRSPVRIRSLTPQKAPLRRVSDLRSRGDGALLVPMWFQFLEKPL